MLDRRAGEHAGVGHETVQPVEAGACEGPVGRVEGLSDLVGGGEVELPRAGPTALFGDLGDEGLGRRGLGVVREHDEGAIDG